MKGTGPKAPWVPPCLDSNNDHFHVGAGGVGGHPVSDASSSGPRLQPLKHHRDIAGGDMVWGDNIRSYLSASRSFILRRALQESAGLCQGVTLSPLVTGTFCSRVTEDEQRCEGRTRSTCQAERTTDTSTRVGTTCAGPRTPFPPISPAHARQPLHGVLAPSIAPHSARSGLGRQPGAGRPPRIRPQRP